MNLNVFDYLMMKISFEKEITKNKNNPTELKKYQDK